MSKFQLIISIVMPIVVIANSWVVALKASKWKEHPPSIKPVIRLIAFVIDMSIFGLIGLSVREFLARDDIPLYRFEILWVMFLGVMVVFHTAFVFYIWVVPLFRAQPSDGANAALGAPRSSS